jgi:hypothetical protein
MWKEKVLDVLSDISDFLGVLREIPEITTQYSESEDSPNMTQKLVKSAILFVVSKVVKTNSICD